MIFLCGLILSLAVSSICVSGTSHSASKCRARGIQEYGVVVNEQTEFEVQCLATRERLKIHVRVSGPRRMFVDSLVQDNHDGTFSVQYTPPMEGVYGVYVMVNRHAIPGSPFTINVSPASDRSKVTAKGPGLEPRGLITGIPASFEVIASDARHGDLAIDVIGPNDNEVDLNIEEKHFNVYDCQYVPQMVGKYVIIIRYNGKQVANSPYHVIVTPAADRVKIYGPGLESGLKTGQTAIFTIDVTEAGVGPLIVNIEGPDRSDVKAKVIDNSNGTYTCIYKPMKSGLYTISIKFENYLLPRCPVKVIVGSSTDQKNIEAWGPGLDRGVAGRPAEFYVNYKNIPIDDLTVLVDGPGKADVEMLDNGDHSLTVFYYPVKPGKYTIHVSNEEMDIKGSPFTAIISRRGRISKVYAEGPGLRDGNMAGTPCVFTVFAKGAGLQNPSVQLTVVADTGEEVQTSVIYNGDHTFTCTYYPKVPGVYTINIKFMDETIPASPRNVHISPRGDAWLY